MQTTRPNGYREALRATTVIGGSSAVNVLLGLVCTKLLALLLGPAGVGLLSIYNGIVATVASVAGLGLGTVGARAVATATSSGDARTDADVRAALRWLGGALAAVGALSLAVGSRSVAHWTLGSTEHRGAVALLGAAVAATILTTAQTALLTGLRRTADIARVSVASGVLGTLAAVVLTLWLRERAVLPFVLAAAACTLGASWFFARRAGVGLLPAPSPRWRREAGSMVLMGSVFMLTGATSAGALLVVRSVLAHRLGLEAAGHFSAAWTISMTYLGFVLTAMGVDYLPRLAAVQDSIPETNRTVNEQAEISLLLAVPILLGATALAPWILATLFSARFEAATSVLRWQMLGDVFKVASWPLAFVLLSRGATFTYALVELTWSGVLLLLVVVGVPRLGLAAVGPAYLAAYIVYFGLVAAVTHHRAIGFTARSWRLVGLGAAGVASVLGLHFVDDRIALAVGALAALLTGVASARRLTAAADFQSCRDR